MRHRFTEKKSYPFLDGWRGIAIIWVILIHISIFFGTTNWPEIVKKIASVGFIGVDIFFVISGFLITGLLIEKLDDKINIKRFYTRRFLKIFPQYISAVIIGIIFYSLTDSLTIKSIYRPADNTSIISYIFLFQNYVQQIPILAHTWSLAIEVHFYLLFPFLLVLICSIQREEHNRRMLLAWTCILLIVLFNAIRYFGNGIDFLSTIVKAPIPFQTTLFRADALIFGCLLKLGEPYYYNIEGNLWKYLLQFGRIAGIFIYVLFIFLGFNNKSWYSFSLAYFGAGLFLFPYKNLLFTDAFVENRFLRWIGRNSYGLYLWHYVLILPFAILSRHYGSIIIIGYVIATILVGVGSTVTIERFFLNLRSKVEL